jgi:two-component sensor histidine kinase/CheY-like chemotaxis protein
MPEAANATRWMRALLVISIAIPLALYAAVSAYLYGERLREGKANVRQTVLVLQEHALRVFEAQRLSIDRVDQRIEGMSWAEIRTSQALHEFLKRASDISPHVDGIWLVSPDGHIANSADFFPVPERDYRDREYFKVLQAADTLHFGEMIVGRLKRHLEFNLGARRSPRDRFDGLILVTASIGYLADFWDRAYAHDNHVVALVRPDGSILARYPAVENVPTPLPATAPLMQAIAKGDSGVFSAVSSLDGVDRVYGFSRVGDYPVYVSLGVGRAEIMAPWWNDLIWHGIVALSAAALLFGISLLALRQTRRLAGAMASWRDTAGRLRAEVDRREKAEDLAAEKQRLLVELGAVTAQRRAILDSMLEGVVAYGPDGRVIYCNDASRQILGLEGGAAPALERMAREGRISALDGTVLDEAAAPVARLLGGETLPQQDLRLSLEDGAAPIVCRFTGAPITDEREHAVGGVLTFADVTEQRTNEERRRLLANELDHRVRNMLATINAMIRLSSHGARDKAALVETLSGRIGAMTRTHNLLTRNSWRGALLREVVADEVQPYASPDRLVLRGRDEVVLPPQDAVDFALVIHELATNAAKYGAWSGADGRVDVSWSLERHSATVVEVLWREQGGPPVSPPAKKTGRRTGFGTTLIRSAFQAEGAGVELRYEPDGVACTIRVPLRQGPGWRALAPAEALPAPPAPPGSLDGLAVLLVEDEPIVRLELAGMLEDAGARVIGPAATVAEAMTAIAKARPDAAVLDINVRGENVSPLAEALLARGVAIVFASGYRDLELLSPRLRHLPLVQKPLRPGELVAALAAETRARPAAV